MVTGFRLLLLLAAAAVCCEGWLGGKGVQPKKEDAVGGPRTLETGGNASSEQVDPDLEKKVDSQSSENQTGVDLAVARDRQENGAEQDHRSDDHSAARSNMLASKPISTRGRYKYTHGNISHYISDSVTGYSLRVVTDQLDEHFKTCGDRCMVRGQPREQCPLHGVAPELLTWMTDLKDLLSVGCKLPQDNKGDRCCIANDAAVSGTLRDITLMIRDVYGVLQDSCSKCPVDGDWSEWSPWTQCSVSCDMGTRWQTRTCNNPSPAHGGQACRGAARLEAVCSLPPCCVPSSWNSWSPWSQCSVTCGDGHRRRSRICADLSPNVCATSCQGPNEVMETCNVNEPRDGNWSPWVAWSVCSVTCGCGMRSRSRQCSNPERNECGSDCIGNNLDKELCYGPPCCEPVDGGWSYWSSWSTCSAGCGPGERTRSRTCNDPEPNKCGLPCPGQPTERERCEGRQCCVDGNWGPWGSPDLCSVTCGTGIQTRSRECDQPPKNDCGRPCPGPKYDIIDCDTRVPCVDPGPPVPCEYEWSNWSQCSVTCGRGIKFRSVQLIDMSLRDVCQNTTMESEICDIGSRDGEWAPWSSWSDCSVRCGSGERRRTRTCTNPRPDSCGQPCPGQDLQRERCEETCCSWSDWSSWSSCNPTCGYAERSRQRFCVSTSRGDRELSCANRCPGSSTDVDSCSFINCEPPPSWSSWEAWCPCDCSTGRSSRRRGCERRYRDGRVVQAGVNLCPGESRQEVYCDVLDTSCPRCVTDCRLRESFGFLENGNYPSCFSCKEYITCTNGVVRYGECPIGREFDAFKRKCVIGSSPSCALVECVRDCSGLDDGNYPSCDLCGAYRQCRNNRLTEILCDGGSEFDMHFEGCRTDNKPSPTCIRSEIGRDVIMLADDPNSDLIEDETIAAQNVTISESGVSGSHKRKHLPRDHETPTDPPVENAADEKILVPVTKLPLSAATKSTNSTNEERNVDAKHRDADDVTTRKRKKPDKKKATSQPKETHKDKKHEKRKMKVREERTNKSLLKVKCYTTCSDPGTFQSCRGCQFYLTCTKHGVAHVRKCPETESWDDLSKKCRLNSSTCSGRVQLVSADGSSSSDPPILDDMS